MKKLGDRLREIVALTRFMQPAGKWRLVMLGIESFFLLLIAGLFLGQFTLVYIAVSLGLSLLYMLVIFLVTIHRLQ